MTREEMYRLIEELTAENVRLKADVGDLRRLVEALSDEMDRTSEALESTQVWVREAPLMEFLSKN